MGDGVPHALTGSASLIVHSHGEPVWIGFVKLQQASSGREDATLDKTVLGADNVAVETLLAWDNLLFFPEGLYEIAETWSHAVLCESL